MMAKCPEPGCAIGVPHVHAVPPAARGWDPDILDALTGVEEALVRTVAPIAGALQDARDATARLLPVFQDTRDTLAAVVGLLDRMGAPSWVQDREILDHARDLIARTDPNGAPDGRHVQPE